MQKIYLLSQSEPKIQNFGGSSSSPLSFEYAIFEYKNKECYIYSFLTPLNAKLTKWPNTLKQFVSNLPTNCLSVFGHFVGLALKGLKMAHRRVSEFFK